MRLAPRGHLMPTRQAKNGMDPAERLDPVEKPRKP